MNLVRAVRWKIKEKRELNLSVFDLILERFDSNLRESNFNDFFSNLPKQLLKERFDLNIPEGMVPRSLKEVLIDRIYERLPAFIPKPGEIVIDIGAQFGDYAYLCAKKFGAEVFSFEPLRKNYEIMLEFLRVNRVNNVHTYNVAIGAENRIVEMMGNTDMIFSPEIYVKNMMEHGTGEIRTLDSFKITAPSIVKIDVEGFEMEVLIGAEETLRLKPKIIVETHTKELRSQVIQHLEGHGYKLIYESATKKSSRNRMEVNELYLTLLPDFNST